MLEKRLNMAALLCAVFPLFVCHDLCQVFLSYIYIF